MIRELPIPYDVLVAATEECIQGYAGSSFVEFVLMNKTPASRKYELKQYEIGKVGEITIRKLKDDLSLIFLDGPPMSLSALRKPTSDELAAIDAIPDKDKRLRAQFALSRRIRNEAEALYIQRKKHLDQVRQAYFNRLRSENIWPQIPEQQAESTQPQPWEKSRPNKRDRDRQIWEMRRDGHTWPEIAEAAMCGVSTAVENYNRMEESLNNGLTST